MTVAPSDLPQYLTNSSDVRNQRSQFVISTIVGCWQYDPHVRTFGYIFDDGTVLTRIVAEFSQDLSELTLKIRSKSK